MGRVAFMVMIMAGMTLLFYLGGLIENTGTSTLLNAMLNPEGLQNTPFNVKLTTIIGLAGAIGLTALAIVQKSDLILIIPFAVFLLSLIWDFLSIVQKMNSAGNPIGTIIFGAGIIGYIIIVAEWWRGTST